MMSKLFSFQLIKLFINQGGNVATVLEALYDQSMYDHGCYDKHVFGVLW